METAHFPFFPSSSSHVHIALFTSLTPTSLTTLRQRIINASQTPSERESVNFAFLNPRLITSRLHLQTAIYQAILAQTQGSLRTKTVHSEILWNLNPTNNITEAIRRYGVSDDLTSLLVVHICGPDLTQAEAQAKMSQVVPGTIVPLNALETITDWTTVKRYHKLNNENGIKNVDVEEERAIVDNIVTSTVAIKSVAA
ncbi:hypothetical protein AX17_004869 [Amanita inopinata Kibby_2008]|nr:hypothetical protein AX17_004869 [Amanita inopinata Kibby_2008]